MSDDEGNGTNSGPVSACRLCGIEESEYSHGHPSKVIAERVVMLDMRIYCCTDCFNDFLAELQGTDEYLKWSRDCELLQVMRAAVPLRYGHDNLSVSQDDRMFARFQGVNAATDASRLSLIKRIISLIKGWNIEG